MTVSGIQIVSCVMLVIGMLVVSMWSPVYPERMRCCRPPVLSIDTALVFQGSGFQLSGFWSGARHLCGVGVRFL